MRDSPHTFPGRPHINVGLRSHNLGAHITMCASTICVWLPTTSRGRTSELRGHPTYHMDTHIIA